MDRWFVVRTPRPQARVQLFCLPYAGRAASVFRDWPAAFGPDVEVLAVQLPGRESRFRERPVIDPDELAAAIVERADRPYAVFGHSMGARLAFEVLRSIRRSGSAMPLRLYPSACPPPHLVLRGGLFHGISRLPDDEVIDRLTRGGGVPAEVLAEPGLMTMMLPVVRADFGWMDDYELTDEAPLPTPFVLFAGADDAVVTPAHVTGWARHTSAECTMHTLPGGHFFMHDQVDAIARIVRADLLDA